VVDGSRIFFTENLPGPQLVLASASGGGGETTTVANHFKQPMWADLSPDRSELLVLASESEAPYSMWIMSTAGGSPRSVGSLEVDDASWCRDSKTIVYSVGPEIYLVSEAGTANRKLATAPGRVSRLRWSPDGRTLRFTVTEQKSDRTTLWQLSRGGPDLRALLPDWNVSSSECCGTWTPDGKYFVFQSTRDGRTDIWAIPEKGGFWGNREGSPIPITSGPMNFTDPTFSDDAKKLFVVGISPRAEIVRHDSATGDFVPFLPGISAEGIAVSRDGEWLTYVAYPEGTVWRCKADGSARLQLTFPPLRPLLPRWSPDGKQIVFFANSPAKPWKIYVVSSEGGPPQQLMPGDQQEGDPTWSSDGSSIVFGGVPWYLNSEVTIGVFDLESRRVSKLPQSEGLFSPRSSPTGRYIAALIDLTHDLMLFDSQTKKWIKLIGPQINYPSFSRDGKYIYFQDWRDYSQSGGRPLRGGLVRVCRIRLSDRKVESLFDIKGIASVAIGTIMPWSGLAPDDSPLLARDISSQELYSLDWPLR
jgi:Tol biopolymer transport system component